MSFSRINKRQVRNWKSRAFCALLFAFYIPAAQAQLSGNIEVYFNQSVDASYSDGSHPLTASADAAWAAILAKIDQAHRSIDVCLYNCDQKNFAAKLEAAKSRGVRVRYITGDEGANSGLSNPAPTFTVFKGNIGSGLMHNKFIIIDASHPDSSQLIMGSMNFTTGNLFYDYNNMVCLYSQALALNYQAEFEEMWGGSGTEPDYVKSRFGEYKIDNTQHSFWVGSTYIESYFSPSDGASKRIADAMYTADDEILFGLLTFTRDEIADAIVSRHKDGVSARGIIDSPEDSGSEFNYLNSQGVETLEHAASTQMHHKYGIIDAKAPDKDPIVITGSHNWTTAAETRNDENTLIFHSAWMANVFKQEFEARWCEEKGGNCQLTSLKESQGALGLQVWPNPVTDRLQAEIPGSLPIERYRLFDAHGRVVQAGLLSSSLPVLTLETANLPAGQYYLQLGSGAKEYSTAFILQR